MLLSYLSVLACLLVILVVLQLTRILKLYADCDPVLILPLYPVLLGLQYLTFTRSVYLCCAQVLSYMHVLESLISLLSRGSEKLGMGAPLHVYLPWLLCFFCNILLSWVFKEARLPFRRSSAERLEYRSVLLMAFA
ncbi:hypothetical protein Tco_0914162 [Tanacetum coccineum]